MVCQNGLSGRDMLQHGNGFMGKLAAPCAGFFRPFPIAVYPRLFLFLVIVHKTTALLALRRGGALMPLGRLILLAGFHLERDNLVASCTNQDFGMAELLLVGLDLFRRQRTE